MPPRDPLPSLAEIQAVNDAADAVESAAAQPQRLTDDKYGIRRQLAGVPMMPASGKSAQLPQLGGIPDNGGVHGPRGGGGRGGPFGGRT